MGPGEDQPPVSYRLLAGKAALLVMPRPLPPSRRDDREVVPSDIVRSRSTVSPPMIRLQRF